MSTKALCDAGLEVVGLVGSDVQRTRRRADANQVLLAFRWSWRRADAIRSNSRRHRHARRVRMAGLWATGNASPAPRGRMQVLDAIRASAANGSDCAARGLYGLSPP